MTHVFHAQPIILMSDSFDSIASGLHLWRPVISFSKSINNRRFSMRSMDRTAVIGIGNDLMGDDAIGPHIVRKLIRRKILPEEVILIDEGRGGMRLVHHIKDKDQVIIIDAADIGKEPGEFTVFRPEEVESIKDLSGTNIHEWDLLKMLDLSKMMGECPEDIQILAIQPKDMDLGEGISAELIERVDDYINGVKDLLDGNDQ